MVRILFSLEADQFGSGYWTVNSTVSGYLRDYESGRFGT
jgi:hypothetical protein